MYDVKNAIIFLIILYIIIGAIRKKIDLFQAYLITLPISFVVPIGLNFFLYHIMIILILLKSLIYKKLPLFNIPISLFLGYIIVTALIMPTYFTNTFVKTGGGFFREDGRFISQIIMILMLYAIVPLSSLYIKKAGDIIKYLKTYLSFLVLITCLGWIQLFVFLLTGTDIFPLGSRDGHILTGQAQVLGSMFMRFGSICGEPKTLSVFLVTAFFIILIFNDKKIVFFKYDFFIRIFFIISAFVTLSTSGIVMFIILYFLFLIYKIFTFTNKINKKKFYLSIVFLFLLALVIYHNFELITDVLNTRLFERDLTSEDYDAPIKKLLTESPGYMIFGSGAGNVHNLSFQYIPTEVQHYMINSIFVAKSGYLKLISEYGIVGTILFIYYHFSIYIKYNKMLKTTASAYTRNIVSALFLVTFFMLLSFLMRVYAANIYIFVFAMLYSLIYADTKNKCHRVGK